LGNKKVDAGIIQMTGGEPFRMGTFPILLPGCMEPCPAGIFENRSFFKEIKKSKAPERLFHPVLFRTCQWRAGCLKKSYFDVPTFSDRNFRVYVPPQSMAALFHLLV